MGWIKFPSEIENHYLSSLGNAWVELSVFDEELEDRFPKKASQFNKLPYKNFMIFYTTELTGQQHDGWEHLMMIIGRANKTDDFGSYINITGMYRYGFAVKNVFSLNDAITELENYFPDGIEHIDQARDENIYYTFLGYVSDFEDLCNTTELALQEAKF